MLRIFRVGLMLSIWFFIEKWYVNWDLFNVKLLFGFWLYWFEDGWWGIIGLVL